jgi:hypothetical protein
VVGSGTEGVEVLPVVPVSVVDDATTTTVGASGLELVVRRVLDGPTRADDVAATLTGTWPESTEPALLAYARRLPS